MLKHVAVLKFLTNCTLLSVFVGGHTDHKARQSSPSAVEITVVDQESNGTFVTSDAPCRSSIINLRPRHYETTERSSGEYFDCPVGIPKRQMCSCLCARRED